MLRPTAPSSMVTSASTSGDSETTPLAVLCGSGIGTRTARTRSWRMTGFESDIVRAQYDHDATDKEHVSIAADLVEPEIFDRGGEHQVAAPRKLTRGRSP